jgi:hypothetical protein
VVDADRGTPVGRPFSLRRHAQRDHRPRFRRRRPVGLRGRASGRRGGCTPRSPGVGPAASFDVRPASHRRLPAWRRSRRPTGVLPRGAPRAVFRYPRLRRRLRRPRSAAGFITGSTLSIPLSGLDTQKLRYERPRRLRLFHARPHATRRLRGTLRHRHADDFALRIRRGRGSANVHADCPDHPLVHRSRRLGLHVRADAHEPRGGRRADLLCLHARLWRDNRARPRTRCPRAGSG